MVPRTYEATVTPCRGEAPGRSLRGTRRLRRLRDALQTLRARLTLHAARGERQRLEPLRGDRLFALDADAVAAGVDVRERAVDEPEVAREAVHGDRGELVVVRAGRAAVRVLRHL